MDDESSSSLTPCPLIHSLDPDGLFSEMVVVVETNYGRKETQNISYPIREEKNCKQALDVTDLIEEPQRFAQISSDLLEAKPKNIYKCVFFK